MTTINSIANLLVTACGLSEAEAFEMAEHEFNTVLTYAELAYEDEHMNDYADCWDDYDDISDRFYSEQLDNYFREYIQGKTYDELDAETWGTYSDMYKDVHGIRPRWYIQSLYEAKQRAEREALENDGWIFLDGYKRQLTDEEFVLYVWDGGKVLIGDKVYRQEV